MLGLFGHAAGSRGCCCVPGVVLRGRRDGIQAALAGRGPLRTKLDRAAVDHDVSGHVSAACSVVGLTAGGRHTERQQPRKGIRTGNRRRLHKLVLGRRECTARRGHSGDDWTCLIDLDRQRFGKFDVARIVYGRIPNGRRSLRRPATAR